MLGPTTFQKIELGFHKKCYDPQNIDELQSTEKNTIKKTNKKKIQLVLDEN